MVLERKSDLDRWRDRRTVNLRRESVTFVLTCSALTVCETALSMRQKEKGLGKIRDQKRCMALATHLIL